MITIIEKYTGKSISVDDTRKILRAYSAQRKTATYSAPIIDDDDSDLEFWADYDAVLTDLPSIDERLRTFGSPVYLAYCAAIDFNADANDPDGSKWQAVVDAATAHYSDLFTKAGDLRQRPRITATDLCAMAEI